MVSMSYIVQMVEVCTHLPFSLTSVNSGSMFEPGAWILFNGLPGYTCRDECCNTVLFTGDETNEEEPW